MEFFSPYQSSAIVPEAAQLLLEHYPSSEAKPQSSSSWSNGLHFESLANLAHELRTPVQVLLGYLDILRDNGDKGGIQASSAVPDRAIVERMNANVHELAQTVDNVLEFALAYGNAEPSCDEEIELAQLFAEVDEVLRGSKSNANLALRINLTNAPRTVFTRRRPLRSIVLNLANNAIKFTAQGEVAVTVTETEPPRSLCIEVRDTGAGISRDLLSSAFEPLVQLSNSSIRSHRGLGLGLTLVDLNLKSLGGHLQIESQLGVGSCFKVSIPWSEARPRIST